MGLTIWRLLEYFSVEELRFILSTINEIQTGNRDELIERVISELPEHNKKWGYLLNFLDVITLRRICNDYELGTQGNRGSLCKKIEKQIQTTSSPLQKTPKKEMVNNKKIKNLQTTHYKFPFPHNKRDWGKIGVIVAIIFGGTSLYFQIFPLDYQSEVNPSLSDCITGEFGLTIRNCVLGIELTRPNPDWIPDIEYESFYIPSSVLPDTDFKVLGSTIIGKKGSASITIRVFETKQMIEQDFKNFAKNFHEEVKRVYPTFEHAEEPFIVGKKAIFEMTTSEDSDIQYISKYQIESYNDRIYVFQDTVRTDVYNVKGTVSELKQIYDSFNFLN